MRPSISQELATAILGTLEKCVGRTLKGGAAAAYYGKTPAQLDVGEAALLAALLPAPEALSPYANPAGAKRVRATTLHCMVGRCRLTLSNPR